ncbi:GAP1-N2 domain-containing protein [Corynebacterium hylobatis]|uniref:GAP1-N2 domain-containing protein n=1 Tax=Corynebacterium hylobatis TaxID=1859290 RepID=UPI0019D1F1A4|nr:hypothetical protein [Corynebacterium hylobatis]
MTAPRRRWSHVTYASFRNQAGGGGWTTGPSINADLPDEQVVAEHAPTSMVPTQSFDDFIGAAEIAELPRRFEYLPLGDRGLCMQSVPAGKDATGRPGNVFTHAFIDHDLSRPLAATYPINLYRSEDLLTPFRIASVNAVTLPRDLQEPRPGPLTDLAVAWMMVTTMLGDRTGALYRLQDVLSGGTTTPVLMVKNANEAVYWLQALSSTLSPDEARRLLRFTTFERAAALPAPLPGQEHPVVVVPATDKDALKRLEGITVIDPADPRTREAQPGSLWSELTRGVFTVGLSPLQVVEFLAGEPAAGNPAEPRFGDGLAGLVKRRPGLFAEGLADVAKQHLDSGDAAAGAARNLDVELVQQVIKRPQLVLENHAWPVLGRADLAEHDYYRLADAAQAGIRELGTQPTEVLIGYLNFLLATGLVEPETVRDRGFRDLFNMTDSFRGGHKASLPFNAHAELQTLLDLAGQDRKEKLYAIQRRGERAFLQLGSSQNIRDMMDWLAKPQVPGILQGLVEDRFVSDSSRNYTLDLLRVYYTVNMFISARPVITGDRDRDRALRGHLADLTLEAVDKYVTQGSIDHPGLEKHGRRIAQQDILSAEFSSGTLMVVMNEVRRHLDPQEMRNVDPAVRQILATVARGIVNEMDRTERAGTDA